MRHPEVDHIVLEDLGSRLEARRRQLSKSAREVAQGAQISAVYLRVIETGLNPKTGRASRPSAEVLVRLARELEIEADELLSLAGYSDLRADEVVRDFRNPMPALPAALAGIADAVALVRTRPNDFMRSVIADDLSRFEAHVAAVAAGSLLCDSADEPRVRKLALLDACDRSLQALSFQDVDWWLGPHAKSYLALYAEKAKRSPPVAMTRIFLLSEPQRSDYGAVFEEQARCGVEVLIADPREVPDICRRDLEIYDRSLLREPLSRPTDGGGRLAEFTDDHGRLQRAEVAFTTVRRVAQRVT